MTRTRRDVLRARTEQFWKWYESTYALDHYYHYRWQHANKEAYAHKVITDWGWARTGQEWSTKWIRRVKRRAVRRHVRMVCRTRQWERLHAKDSKLKDWLD